MLLLIVTHGLIVPQRECLVHVRRYAMDDWARYEVISTFTRCPKLNPTAALGPLLRLGDPDADRLAFVVTLFE
jgi:hypothetical protein